MATPINSQLVSITLLTLGLIVATCPLPTRAASETQTGTAGNNGIEGSDDESARGSSSATGGVGHRGQPFSNKTPPPLIGPQMIKGGVSNYDQYRRLQLGLPIEPVSAKLSCDTHGPPYGVLLQPLASLSRSEAVRELIENVLKK